MSKRVLSLSLFTVGVVMAAWAVVHFAFAKRDLPPESGAYPPKVAYIDDEAWAAAVEKVKADRPDDVSGSGGLVIPPELRHYSNRHWFLATQVAEITRYNLQTCQDFIELAAMTVRGELISVPLVTNTYVLFGVGAKADETEFTVYIDDRSIPVFNEAQLSEAYRRLDDKRVKLQSELARLRVQSSRMNKRSTSFKELQNQVTAQERELISTNEEKSLLDQVYSQPDSRRKLFHDYESLQTLSRNFAGRSYNLDDPADRMALKINMLRSLRPQALKILEGVASAYQREFDRPLPVSSLVRPEQYQRELNKVNRNAVLIDTTPHSTGLAFDIDYRYMSASEENFLMAELARLKNEGRIEVIRERGANYHVFVFMNGSRPSDDLITASLEKAGAPIDETRDAQGEAAANLKHQPEPVKPLRAKPRKRR